MNTFQKSLVILLLAFWGCQATDKQNHDQQKAVVSVYEHQARNADDPFLTQRFLDLNNSPMQEKLRSLQPFPVGVVYYQQRGHGLDEIRQEFGTIRDLGFTALKQMVLVSPNNPADFEKEVYHMAIDEGISPWYYGNGGWVGITQPLLDSLGITLEKNNSNRAGIQTHPRMIEYQNEMMHRRVDRMSRKPIKPKGMGEPGRNSPYLPDRLIPEFAKWLQSKYGSMKELNDAWNSGFAAPPEIKSFSEAAALLRATKMDEYGNRWGAMSWDFRRMRDSMRFQADLIINNYNETMQMFYQWDPDEPERTGGHQLFENQAVNSWDLEAQAKTASVGGSFYSSIHLAHHFFLTNGEIIRPVYMQSRIVADMFKGGWAATWESTGGPTQWSGHHNVTVDGNMMKQLFLSYIAAGLKGIGLWTWNSRDQGWETGEYALTDIQGEPTERAYVAGELSRILQQQRFELWQAFDEPMVGILYSWENEAMLGRLSLGTYQLSTPVYETNRDRLFRQYHSQARIGISRALINHNIPFEYVTDRDIAAGLAHRYPVIYLPYVLALDQETLTGLMSYVEEGGRLVADFPLLMMDNYGRLNKQLPGSDFETLFGFSTADYLHTVEPMPKIWNNESIESQYGQIKITTAAITSTFDDGNPAVLDHSFGKGKTRVFNFEAGRLLAAPGRKELEQIIAQEIIEGIRPPFRVENSGQTMVFRRAAPLADHYFLINDGEDATVKISSEDIDYSSAFDVISNTGLKLTGNSVLADVPAWSGVWLRLEKKRVE